MFLLFITPAIDVFNVSDVIKWKISKLFGWKICTSFTHELYFHFNTPSVNQNKNIKEWKISLLWVIRKLTLLLQEWCLSACRPFLWILVMAEIQYGHPINCKVLRDPTMWRLVIETAAVYLMNIISDNGWHFKMSINKKNAKQRALHHIQSFEIPENFDCAVPPWTGTLW